jgi:hypothetical protein
MGTKRVGLARVEALIENLKRDLALAGATLGGVKKSVISLDNAGAAVSRTLLATESDAVVFLNVTDDTGGRGISVILPAPAAGLQYHFVVADAGDGTNDIVIKTSADAVDIKGAANSVKTGVEGGVIAGSTLTFDISDLTTKTDLNGTSFSLISDGTHYYILGGLLSGGEDAIGTGVEVTATTDVDD